MIIRPVVPYLFHINQEDVVFFITGSVLLLLAVIVTALQVAKAKAEKFGKDKKKLALLFVGVGTLLTVSMLCFFGYAAAAVQGILFSLVIAYSSYEDIKTRECDDYLHLMIVAAAFIGTDLTALPGMIISAAFAGSVMLAAFFFAKGRVGGADIKFVAACSFLLGLNRGLFGLLAGTLLAILVNIFKKDKNKGFPMIPYLAVGYLAAFFIQIGGK